MKRATNSRYFRWALVVAWLAGWSHAKAEKPGKGPAADDPGGSKRVVGHGDPPFRTLCSLDWNPEDELTAAMLSDDGASILTGACNVNHSASVNPYSTQEEALFPTVEISGGLPEVILWNAVTGAKLRVFHGHWAPARCFAFSPSGRYVASAGARNYVPVRMPNLKKTENPLKIQVAIGRDIPAMEEGGLVKLWDVASARELFSLPVPGRGIAAIAFSSDGVLLEAFCSESGITAWNVNTGHVSFAVPVEKNTRKTDDPEDAAPWLCVDWRHLVLTTKNAMLRGRSAQGVSGRFLPVKPESPTPMLRCVAFSPDGTRFVTGGQDGSIRAWDCQTGKLVGRADFKEGGGAEEHGDDQVPSLLTFSSDGSRFLSGHRGGMVHVWSALDCRRLQSVQGPKGQVVAAVFLEKRLRVVSGGSRHGRFDVDPKTGAIQREALTVWEDEVVQPHSSAPP
ncbi:MAG: hypothetical protein NVSMB9_11920 [Isosphaeraceae bacterium]